jgi:hypothetical protein
MSGSVFLVENVFSTLQFPAHVVSASSAAVDMEAFRVANGRRWRRDRWSPSVTGDAWIRVLCDQPRYVSMLAMDGHNLAGFPVRLEISNTGFGGEAYERPIDVTVPAVSTPGALEDPAGVLSEDGQWLARLPVGTMAWGFRLFIPAMGGGLIPEITGLRLGRTWDLVLRKPFREDGSRPVAESTRSSAGWAGRTQVVPTKEGQLRVELEGFHEYDEARYFQSQYELHRPTVFVPDAAQGDRATIIANQDNGVIAFGFEPGDTSYRVATIPYEEHEAPLP